MRHILLSLLIPGLLSLSGLNVWIIDGADTLHRIFHEIGERGSDGLSRVWDGTHRCERDEGFANAKKIDKKTAALLLKEKKNPSDQMESLFFDSDLTPLHRVCVRLADKPVFLKAAPPTPPPNFVS